LQFTSKRLVKTISFVTGTENNYTPFIRTLITTTENILNKQIVELSKRRREFEYTTREKELHNSDNTSDFNLSSDSIKYEDDHWSSSDTKISNVDLKPPNIIEPEINDYDGVDILDDKNVWKPKLVFENKTKTTTSSVIMRIGPKNTDVELFNIETAPFQESKLMI